MSTAYPASTISVKCIGTSPPTCVATKVEGNGVITEADLKGEGTAVRDVIVETVRRTLSASKAPASDKPYITIKDDVGAVIGTDGTTATITRDKNATINFNDLVTTNSTVLPVWKFGGISIPDGTIPSYMGVNQVYTGTVGTMGTGTASVTITVKPPVEAAKPPDEPAKPAQFTIKIKQDMGVYQKDSKNYIDKKPSDTLDLNTLVVVEPAAEITWTAGFLPSPSNGILKNTDNNTEIIYTGTVNGSTFGNSKAVISITVKTTGAADGGRRKKGSTLRRRVGRILRKTGTRGKRG